jgi:hypothetical protein
MTATCTKCKVEKPLDEFYTAARKSNGRQSACKRCLLDQMAARYVLTPARKRYNADYHRRAKYGLEPEEFEEMLASQEGLCKLCSEPLDTRPVVDHCHATGEVRGLLHTQCNTILGMAKDDPNILLRAIDYLETSHESE